MADRIAVMRAGKLVQFGPAADVYLKPVNRFMATFFGAVNDIPAMAEGDRISTAFGSLPQPDGMRSGPVEMLVRPEGVRLGGQGSGDMAAEMTVADIRLIGPYWRVQLTGTGLPTLRARTIKRPPPPGDTVRVAFDPERVILFPSGMDGL